MSSREPSRARGPFAGAPGRAVASALTCTLAVSIVGAIVAAAVFAAPSPPRAPDVAQDVSRKAPSGGVPGIASDPVIEVSAPSTIARATELDPPGLAGRTRPDAPVVALPDGRHLVSHVTYRNDAGGIERGFVEHFMLAGPSDDPYRSIAWRKRTCRRTGAMYPDSARHPLACTDVDDRDGDAVVDAVAFPDPGGVGDVVALWFVGVHAPEGAAPEELIGFLHEERIGGSGGVPGDVEGTTAIALARSTDAGDSWHYLGRIATAHGVGGVGGAAGARAPVPAPGGPHNVQGAPFVVEGGHYLVYHVDRDTGLDHPGIAVSRAPVADVLAAARAGGIADLWEKLSIRPDGSHDWVRASRDPRPAYVMEKPAWAGPANRHLWPLRLWGITHVQAVTRVMPAHVHPAARDADRDEVAAARHYLVLTGMGSDGGTPDDAADDVATYVRLFGSRDGLLWEPVAGLAGPAPVSAGAAGEGGFQYCGLAGLEGLSNGRFVDGFTVDCVHEGAAKKSRGRVEGDVVGDGNIEAPPRWEHHRTLVRWRVSLSPQRTVRSPANVRSYPMSGSDTVTR